MDQNLGGRISSRLMDLTSHGSARAARAKSRATSNVRLCLTVETLHVQALFGARRGPAMAEQRVVEDLVRVVSRYSSLR